jgi:hypothetical protein
LRRVRTFPSAFIRVILCGWRCSSFTSAQCPLWHSSPWRPSRKQSGNQRPALMDTETPTNERRRSRIGNNGRGQKPSGNSSHWRLREKMTVRHCRLRTQKRFFAFPRDLPLRHRNEVPHQRGRNGDLWYG